MEKNQKDNVNTNKKNVPNIKFKALSLVSRWSSRQHLPKRLQAARKDYSTVIIKWLKESISAHQQ